MTQRVGHPRSGGRPPRTTTLRLRRVGSGSERILAAWLLRVGRLGASGNPFPTATAFADAFCGGRWTETVDAYKISRWETGVAIAPQPAVARYEELLQLRPGSLVSVLDMINRYLAPHLESASRLIRPPIESLTENDHDRLADILDKVHQDAIVTGSEWDELTSFVARQPHIGLLRRGSWPRMAERLLSEMIIADGTAWTQRYESFSRLLAHPIGQRAAVAACGELAADPSNQVFVDTLSILDASPHPDAGHQLLRQLRRPTNGQAFYGALLGCVRKSQYGHFTPDDRQQLLGLTADLSHNLPRTARRRRLAEQIHGALLTDTSGAARILRADEVFEQHRLVDVGTAEVIVRRLLVSVRSAMAAERDDFHDDLLPVLLDELLFGPLSDIRLFLAMLLAASPYRCSVAGALAAELRRSTATVDANLAISLITALAIIGDQTEAAVLQTLIVRQDVPAKVRSTAARYLGHMTVNHPNDVCRRAVRFHLRRWRLQHDSQSAEVLVDLAYSLGIAADNTALALLTHQGMPTGVRAAASWWRNMPTNIRSSIYT